MTIAGRNKFLIIGIIITILLCVIGISTIVFLILHDAIRFIPIPKEAFEGFVRMRFFSYNIVAVITGIAAFPIISAILLLYIYLVFEKTHAFEISFFSLFIFGIAFEVLKVLFPLFNTNAVISNWVPFIARIMLFARFFAFFALFTASLFAYKTFTQETLSIIFLLCFISFSILNTVPINALKTTSFFLFSRYYTGLLYWFNSVICLLSMASFFLIGIARSISEYKKAGLSILFLFFAYTLLLYCGSWPFIAAGIIFFFISGLFFIRSIHRFYLWQ